MNQYVFEPVKPIVQTKYGKLRGVTYGEVNMFFGVQYAKAKRFMMPEEPDAWEGVKNAFRQGPVSKLLAPHEPFDIYRGLHLLHKESEDCQNLNIWAPKSVTPAKKPVIVWMHGGGFVAGNAYEEYSFDGFNLCHYGDVVFVSINHRLGLLGHLDLSSFGEQFDNSVNAGIWDLLYAMRWIHENIAAFGGDPDNVTIAGHSGGGAKVMSMFQIEEAKDYFSRAIVMSGVAAQQEALPEESAELAERALAKLNITKENIEEIYTVDYDALVKACNEAGADMGIRMVSLVFAPQKNKYYAGLPAEHGFAPYSLEKPCIFGTVLGEFPMVRLTAEEKEAMTEADKLEYLKGRFGEHVPELLKLFKEAYPTHDTLDLGYIDLLFREPTRKTAIAKAALNPDTKNWIYIGSYNCPENYWVPMWHGADVAYAFMNEDRVYVLNEAIYGQKLSKIFSSIFLNFAKTGDPNNNYLPEWKPITPEHHYTMVIDRECACREGHDDPILDRILEIDPTAHRLFAKRGKPQ